MRERELFFGRLERRLGPYFRFRNRGAAVALGVCYPESAAKNESGLHSDLVCGLSKGGRVELDGRSISANGIFLDLEWPPAYERIARN